MDTGYIEYGFMQCMLGGHCVLPACIAVHGIGIFRLIQIITIHDAVYPIRNNLESYSYEKKEYVGSLI